jgi:peroxiredoxin
MSGDPIDKLQRFSTEKCAGKFAVGTATAATIRAYDVGFKPPANFPAAAAAQFATRSDRTTYVITPDGKVAFVHSAMSPRGHVEQSLQAVRAWRAAHPARRRG